MKFNVEISDLIVKNNYMTLWIIIIVNAFELVF